jgi:hypothetical protein
MAIWKLPGYLMLFYDAHDVVGLDCIVHREHRLASRLPLQAGEAQTTVQYVHPR